MSAIIEVTIRCDGCLTVAPCDVSRRAHLVRALLRRQGWHRDNGIDVCPDCWPAGVRGPIIRRRAA